MRGGVTGQKLYRCTENRLKEVPRQVTGGGDSSGGSGGIEDVVGKDSERQGNGTK